CFLPFPLDRPATREVTHPFLPGLLVNEEMTPRSIRRSVNPNPETAPKAAHLNGNRAQRIPFWPGGSCSDKSRIHSRRPNLLFSLFSLATRRRTIHSGLLTTRELRNFRLAATPRF